MAHQMGRELAGRIPAIYQSPADPIPLARLVVIWAHHGMFCSGDDFDVTFGFMHTVEKSAEVLIKVLSMSSNKLQTIRTGDSCDRAFGHRLPQLSCEYFIFQRQHKA